MNLDSLKELKFYVVVNSEGKFFRAKGQHGYGETWVEAKRARVYAKIGPARAAASYFYNSSSKYPAPDIVEISIGGIQVLDEKVRLEKQKKKKDLEDARRTEEIRKYQVERAKRKLEEAKETIKRLTPMVDDA